VQYYVMKTGMEMFDASRAYGLASIFYRLGLIKDTDKKTTIKDMGFYYEVDGPEIDEIPDNLNKEENWVSLFDHTQPWWRHLYFRRIQTTKDKNTGEKKVPEEIINFLDGYTAEDEIKEKDFRESFVRSMIARKVLTEGLLNTLNKYSGFYSIEFTDVKDLKKGYWTLPQWIDVSASKGIREEVRMKTQYNEGTNISVPLDDLALAQIGFAFSKRVSGKPSGGKPSFTLTFMPNPKNIEIESHYNIVNELGTKRLCNVSEGTALSHYSVHLVDLIRGKITENERAPEYSSLIFNALKPTAQQPKPSSGGLFPLDFLYDLMKSNLNISGEIFEMWDHVFRIGNVKGREDLSLSLSEFIAHPSADNLEKYLKIHLRYLLNDDVKIRAYPRECVKEVTKNVGS